jgi:site-specific DNA recombinase
VISVVKERLTGQKSQTDCQKSIAFDHAKLTSLVSQIEVQKNRLLVSLKPSDQSADPDIISVPWQKPPFKRFRDILLPHGTLRNNIRRERPERRARLVNAIARGRSWLHEIVSGSVTSAEQLAKRERCTVRHVNLTLSLAFLAPQLVNAAVEGRLPRGINIERLRDPDADWSRQFQDLGLQPD